MIGRVWRGWTTPGQADAYEHLLRDEIFSRSSRSKFPDSAASAWVPTKARAILARFDERATHYELREVRTP